MLEPSLAVNPYYYIMCIHLSWSTATLPIINSLCVAISVFLGAEARSFHQFIRLVFSNTCMLETSLAMNPYYSILCIQLSCFTATLPIIHSLGVALSLFLGAGRLVLNSKTGPSPARGYLNSCTVFTILLVQNQSFKKNERGYLNISLLRPGKMSA